MKILVTGATGMVGHEFLKRCAESDVKVNFLTSHQSKLNYYKNAQGFLWSPQKSEIDENCIKGVDKILNLVGANIVQPWTEAHKKAILSSRVKSAELLKNTLAKNENDISQIVSASAIGIYPSSQQKYYQENTEKTADNFLGGVVKKWEDSVDAFSELGLDVAKIRIGLVLSNQGGMLSPILKTINNYVGAPLGSGKQWQSWIHIYDLSQMLLFALKKDLDGTYNGVAPNPVSNKKMTELIARQQNKPLWLPAVPELVLKTAMGERSCLVLNSQRVSSEKIERQGFQFKYSNLVKALEELL